jgi:hypothetical protein
LVGTNQQLMYYEEGGNWGYSTVANTSRVGNSSQDNIGV